jgi:hypothetical protein
MQTVIEHITALLEHFRLENMDEKHRCFYCGGLHRTVDCKSSKRKAFHLHLATLAKQSIEETTLANDSNVCVHYNEVSLSELSSILKEREMAIEEPM